MISSLMQKASGLRQSFDGTRRPPGLDSTQEDLHTQDLLFTFPDELSPDFLDSDTAISAKARLAIGRVSDCYGGPEVVLPTDIRILIAYSPDAAEKALLFDSHAPSVLSQRTKFSQDSRGGNASRRRASVHHYGRALSPSTRARLPEDRPETDALLECVFGTAPLSYKGPGTRLHILSDGKPVSLNESPSLVEKIQSGQSISGTGRSSSKPTQPSSPMIPGYPSTEGWRQIRSPRKGKRLLLTRIFSVEVPRMGWDADESGRRIAVRLRQPAETTEFVTFAVAMIIRTPRDNPSYTASGRSLSRQSSVIDDDRAFSPHRASLTSMAMPLTENIGQRTRSDSTRTQSQDTDMDTDLVGEYWTNLSRPLAALHHMIKLRLVEMMVQDLAVGLGEARLGSQPRRTPNLPSGLLQDDEFAINFSSDICKRIQRGLRIPRVIPGHERWGAWKEEVRWVSRWIVDHNQDMDFLAKIFTAFFAVNQESLCNIEGLPDIIRGKPKAHHGEDSGISHRIIVVSDDKMAARRLEFLLAAFYPGLPHTKDVKIARSFESTSPNAFSLSPFGMKIGNQHQTAVTGRDSSLRRNPIDASVSQPGSTSHSPNLRSEHAQRFLDKHHGRRRGESRETRSLDIPRPVLASLTAQRKSTATTATATHLTAHTHVASPGNVTPVDSESGLQSSSSASLAAIASRPTLSASGTGDGASRQTSRDSTWGGWLTNVLSRSKNTSSASQSTAPAHSKAHISPDGQPGGAASRAGKDDKSDRKESIVAQRESIEVPQVNENRKNSEAKTATPIIRATAKDTDPAETSLDSWQSDLGSSFEEPFKISIDREDGVVDVEIPQNELGMGLGSPLSSPEASGIWSNSLPQTNTSDPMTHRRQRNMPSIQLAGWLKYFHPDFVMQANKPNPNLENQIMWAMDLESTPMPALLKSAMGYSTETSRWIDVTETLIIDLQKFEIKRLTLKRLVKILPIARVARDVRMSGYGNPYEDSLAPMGTEFMGSGENVEDNEQGEQDWTREPADPDLAAAIQAVIKGTPPGSGLHSQDRSSVGSLERSGVLSGGTSSVGSYKAVGALATRSKAGESKALDGTPPMVVDYERPMSDYSRRRGEDVRNTMFDALERVVGKAAIKDGDDADDQNELDEEMKTSGVLRQALRARMEEES